MAVGGSACVFAHASREQGTASVSSQKNAILKIELYNMSENVEIIFSALVNRK